MTINPYLNVNQYPLPRPKELFAALNNGQHFTKLDLSEAYLQIELEEESKKYLVINSHTVRDLIALTDCHMKLRQRLLYFDKSLSKSCQSYQG